MMATAELCVVLVMYVCVCVCSCVSDYYALLEVSRSASAKEIKKAFHKLALKHHPDKNQSPHAQQTFTRIAQAYEVLSNKEKRRVYDQMDHITKRDQGRESEDMGSDPFSNKDFYSTNSFQHFTLQELLRTLQLDDDPFMGEEPSYDGWSFNFGAEDEDDEKVFLSDLFNMM